jgi:hypothetical protein
LTDRRHNCHDLANEERDVDCGRARLHAGRVVAKIAPVRLDDRLMRPERRVDVTEIGGVVLGTQTSWDQCSIKQLDY